MSSTPSPSAWILYLGRQVQDGSNPNEVARTVEEIIPHAQFNNTLFNNDIALMKLSSAVSFTDYIQPICLASSTSLFHNGTQCWATGWGRIEKDVPLPPPKTLQEVDVPVIGNRQCTCQYASAKDADITENMICAGQENKGICQGDSGGPVQCKQGSVWVQAGIASFGIPCATSGFPEVYARVSRYEDWIKDKVGSTVGFVTFRSAGDDPDSSFKCSNTANLIFPQFFLSVSLLVLFSTLMH
ncbi:hypothetical protein JZ751_026343 [Albula glossodonta]|uniref:Peptidase S1 domain-containing protein n=1 Tax=Albula glossodonta TaxID=121402 RepID=A0A8T2PD75_9TELE|nr:hypothetical protein JZ751_026343 [Albula glossodonta]